MVVSVSKDTSVVQIYVTTRTDEDN
jgi:hypothetical protein